MRTLATERVDPVHAAAGPTPSSATPTAVTPACAVSHTTMTHLTERLGARITRWSRSSSTEPVVDDLWRLFAAAT